MIDVIRVNEMKRNKIGDLFCKENFDQIKKKDGIKSWFKHIGKTKTGIIRKD